MQLSGALLKDGSVPLQKLKTAGVTAGSILFAGAANALAEDNANFGYDVATKTLRLGFNDNTAPVFSIAGDPAAAFPFSACIYGPVFSGMVDPVIKWGFNLATTGSRVNNARGQLTMSFEGLYVGTQEWHIEGLLANGTAKRWLTINSNEDTGYAQVGILDVDSLNIYATDVSDGGGSGGGVNVYGSIATSLKFKSQGGPYLSDGRPFIQAQINSQALLAGVLDAGSSLYTTRTRWDARASNKQIIHAIGEPGLSDVDAWSWGRRGLVSIHGDYTTNTGNQTQNKACGQVRIANGNSSVTVTNDLCDATNYKPVVLAMVQNSGGGTNQVRFVDVNNGSFTINLVAASSGTTVIGWWLFYVDN